MPKIILKHGIRIHKPILTQITQVTQAKTRRIALSASLWGTKMKYYVPLLENIALIKLYNYPLDIVVHVDNSSHDLFVKMLQNENLLLPNIKIIDHTTNVGTRGAMWRYHTLLYDYDVINLIDSDQVFYHEMFTLYCTWWSYNKNMMMIWDHPKHRRFMAGRSGFTKLSDKEKSRLKLFFDEWDLRTDIKYGDDELILDKIFDAYKADAVHFKIPGLEREYIPFVVKIKPRLDMIFFNKRLITHLNGWDGNYYILEGVKYA
jgi:hypothetical protein